MLPLLSPSRPIHGPTPPPSPSPSTPPASAPPGLGPLLHHLAGWLPSWPWLAGIALLALAASVAGYTRLLGWRHRLRVEHDTDPLRQLVAAGTGLRHHEHACIQVLARPAAPRRIARLRRTPAQLRDPAASRGLDAAAPLRWLLDALTPGPAGAGSKDTTRTALRP